jgi:hypothetical protein
MSGITQFESSYLAQANSTFLTDDLVVKRSNRKIIIAIVFCCLGIIAIFIAPVLAAIPYGLTIVLLVLGALALYVGVSGFNVLKSVKKLPKVKVNDAQNGLNVIQGSLIAEKNTLKSPLGKKDCIFYQIDLQELIHTKNGSYWSTITTYARGTPSVLTDGTGYIAFDFSNADISLDDEGLRLYALDSEGALALTKSIQGEDLIKYVNSNPYEFDPTTVGVMLGNPTKYEFELFRGTELSFMESIIPAESGFTLGKIVDVKKSFNGKPVKAMIYDQGTGLLAFKNGTEASFEKRKTLEDYVIMGVGVLLVVGALIF